MFWLTFYGRNASKNRRSFNRLLRPAALMRTPRVWLNHTHTVLHVDHFVFGRSRDAFYFVCCQERSQGMCYILLIATFTVLLQAFFILKSWGLFEANKRLLDCLLLERSNPTNQWFLRARPCVRVHLLFCHYKAARPHYIDHWEGWQYIEREKWKLLICKVFISRHKGPFRNFLRSHWPVRRSFYLW